MIKHIVLIVLLASFSLVTKAVEKSVTVKLNYGAQKEIKTVQIPFTTGMTALEALMHAAEITTHPLKDYVFVISIDGVKSKRGEMAWYYKINGQSTHKLAIHKTINEGDVITWLYIKDVCSGTVDNCEAIP